MAHAALTAISELFSTVSEETILAAMDPWTLACAVGAENGSIGVALGFDSWLRMSRANFLPQVKLKSGASERRIVSVLRQFVAANVALDYHAILREQESKRGQMPSMVLGPGESVTVTLPLAID